MRAPTPRISSPTAWTGMFLPCDCGHWSGKRHCVDGAIVDYELRNWCKQITYKKAAPVGDSRLMLLGLDNARRPGGAPPAGGRTWDSRCGFKESRRGCAARGSTTRGGEGSGGPQADSPAFNFGPQSPDFVGLYAAQRDECESEMPMPCAAESNQSQSVQGLLSYAIVDILSRTARPITYGELANLVRDRLCTVGNNRPADARG